jgi:hypothetical protein
VRGTGKEPLYEAFGFRRMPTAMASSKIRIGRAKGASWNARKAALTPDQRIGPLKHWPASKQRAPRTAEPGDKMLHLAVIDAT